MSETVVKIPSRGFARGAIVRLRVGGPNMLVVRGHGSFTAVVSILGDEGGNVRLFDVATDDLVKVLDQGPITEAVEQALAEYFFRNPRHPTPPEARKE